MLLKLNRSQKKGMMGGVKFILGARAELTPQEQRHVSTYSLGGTILWDMSDVNPNAVDAAGWIKRLTKTYTIQAQTLVTGTQIECNSITEMLTHEKVLKEACENFKAILEAAAKFGGEEIIRIGEPEPAPALASAG